MKARLTSRRSGQIALAAALTVALASVGFRVWADESTAPPALEAPSDAATSPSAGTSAPAIPEVSAKDGQTLYNRFCLACHGTYGDGRGPATPWLWPRPRDFTRGEYKWRTTPSGSPPRPDDIAQAIRFGVPGTSMHGFGSSLAPAQIDALVGYVLAFGPAPLSGAQLAPVPIPPAPQVTPALLARGQDRYSALGCVACHGPDGRGDGPAAATLKSADGLPAAPYDLTTAALRRPRPPTSSPVSAIYTSLVTGLTGTAMPSYAGSVPDEDLWAVAAYAASLRSPEAPPAPSTLTESGRIGPLAAQAIELDGEQRESRAGYWPGHGDPDERAVFGQTIPFQGPPPAALSPAQASLDARRCERCHAKQVREWTGSFHAEAASPGLLAQLTNPIKRGPMVESCQRCHAPLAEQLPVTRPGHLGDEDSPQRYQENPRFDPALRHQGINCASCHVRNWTRLGPPRAPGSKLLALPGYPMVESELYERGDFCLGCHQLPARLAVNGRPLLDTYREWLEGPYMRRGVQCQHCHMPNREHTWKGVHDPDTFRQGIALEAIAGRSSETGAVSVRARVRNVGAGHYLPTTPTPAAWLSVELVDARGRPIPGAYAEKRIGRHLSFERGWVEHEDTRIPPGEALELAAAWKDGAVAHATHARVKVRVVPDDYYEGLYRRRLAGKLSPEVRAMFQEALDRAEAARYVARDELIDIAPPR